MNSLIFSILRSDIQNITSGERSVLRLGSLCLPCYMRDTAYNKFMLYRPLFISARLAMVVRLFLNQKNYDILNYFISSLW